MPISTEKTRNARPQKSIARDELITFDQFFEMVGEEVKADLLDGRIICEPPAVPRHGFIVTWIISLIGGYIDRVRKYVLYADHGVKEYWIIDPLQSTIEFYENQDGEFLDIKPDAQGRLHSKVLPGFWLKSDWLAANPLPPVLKTLQEFLDEGRRLT